MAMFDAGIFNSLTPFQKCLSSDVPSSSARKYLVVHLFHYTPSSLRTASMSIVFDSWTIGEDQCTVP